MTITINFTLATLLLGLWSISISHAALITFDATNIAGNTWLYDYTVENTGGFDIEEFSIYFDYTLYENLVNESAPANWDPLAVQPDTGLPDDGFYDALALVAGIASGDTLSGFSIQFDYLGANAPGSQPYDIFDPISFNVLASGNTQSATQTVPEPAIFWLLLSGLGLLIRHERIRSMACV